MTYATWDTETTIKTSFKRKANPFDPANWVVTHGWKHKGDSHVTEYRFGNLRPGPGWLKPVLSGCRLLIGFNIKFDLLHALQDPENLEAWMDYVAGGGNVWDCQLAEYLLEGMGQGDHMLSLDEVAPRYGGNVKVDEVKVLWNAGVNTPDIDPELLSRYLCGGDDENGEFQLGDVENTEKIALAQIGRARSCGQLNSILMNMGALIFTTEAERNGMFVDKQEGMRIAAQLKLQVQALNAALSGFLPELPFEFNWGSPIQKSALIFGGTVQWDAYEYDTADGGAVYRHIYEDWESHRPCTPKPNLVYAQKEEVHYLLQDGSTMECLWWEHLVWTEWASGVPDSKDRVLFTSGKNKGEPKTKKVKVDNLDKPKGRAVKAPFIFPRITEPKDKWKNDSGWSTASEVIEELGSRNIPFLKVMAEYQKLSKDLGTYYYSLDKDGKASGMLTLVNELGIVHHMLNMTSTVTGRLSSSNPNLQNIPKGNKSDVKTLFKSRFGKWITDGYGTQVWVSHGKIIQSDFTSLEIYIQALLTKCQQLIADLKAGLDMHCLRLANTEGRDYSEVLKLAKGYVDSLGAFHAPISEWDYKRTDSKVYSFQAAYGAGDAKIAETTGMSVERVAALRAADDARYPEINAYFDARAIEIKANRKPWRSGVPHPDIRGLLCNLGKSCVRTPDGKLYSYLESPSPEYLAKRGVLSSFSPTEIKNYEVQGEGGEWAKAAMWLSVREFYRLRNFGGLGLLVNQVHDAEYADADDSVAHEVAATLHACMEAASDFMEFWFKWEIHVPVPSDTSWGTSMMDDVKVPGLVDRAREIRLGLRTRYMGGYTPVCERQV